MTLANARAGLTQEEKARDNLEEMMATVDAQLEELDRGIQEVSRGLLGELERSNHTTLIIRDSRQGGEGKGKGKGGDQEESVEGISGEKRSREEKY